MWLDETVVSWLMIAACDAFARVVVRTHVVVKPDAVRWFVLHAMINAVVCVCTARCYSEPGQCGLAFTQ